MKKFFHTLLVTWSAPLTVIFVVIALAGAYVSKDIELKLSLTDLLPQDHPGVIKFNKLTEIVGGVGYLEVVLHAEDKISHLKLAPHLVSKFKSSPLVRSAFFLREEHFFLTRALYYAEMNKLEALERSVSSGMTRAKRKMFDIGLWDEEKKEDIKSTELDPELKKFADRAAEVSPYLISKDGRDLLVMVKPNFDSLDMNKSKEMVKFAEEMLGNEVNGAVSFRLSGRYYSKVKDAELIEKDIFVLGLLSNFVMAAILLFYFRSVRAVISIFIPVVLGLGMTALLTRIFIGHINIITGFLVGIISGVGSDYGIHLLWRIRLEQREPSSDDPDPLWRTLMTCGWANFVTIISTGICFFIMCASSFKVFSEFGFICGVGLSAILLTKMGSFYFTSKLLKLEEVMKRESYPFQKYSLPLLDTGKKFWTSIAITVALVAYASQVKFEFDFEKMMQHSAEARATGKLVDDIYDRSTVPSAFAAPTRDQAVALEKYLKDNYMPKIIASIVAGATIIPEDQAQKAVIIDRIREQIRPIRDNRIQEAAGVNGKAIRTWVEAKPFTFGDLPIYVQEALRGTQQAGYLLYVYPTEHLNSAAAVSRFAGMLKDAESKFPEVVSGSDAGIFSDILGLIKRDGILLFSLILLFVGLFIWLNLRNVMESAMCYIPFVLALPASVGLMALFGVKFNIFNIALLPAFIAVGIEIPVQLMQRSREVHSGFKSVRDIAVSLQLSLATTIIGFGTLIFTRAGVLKSLGWISLMSVASIWFVGVFLQPAILDRYYQWLSRKNTSSLKGQKAQMVDAT